MYISNYIVVLFYQCERCCNQMTCLEGCVATAGATGAMLQENVAMCDLGKGCVATNRKMLQYIARQS